jgi:hypothetical protein
MVSGCFPWGKVWMAVSERQSTKHTCGGVHRSPVGQGLDGGGRESGALNGPVVERIEPPQGKYGGVDGESGASNGPVVECIETAC